jgi:capsular exopolysaccharide synthesis family protein
MTRLSDALERARRQGEQAERDRETPASTSAEPSSSEEVGAWRFDEEDLPLGAPPADGSPLPAAPAVQSEPASVDGAAQPVGDGTAEPGYPFLVPDTERKLIIGSQANATLVEQFRRAAAALHHAQRKTGARTVMVASALEAEGKTLTAANLALTLSHSYQKQVLLVDADLRRPSIHELFRLDNRTGLVDILKQDTAETRLPAQELSPTLWVMTAGHPTSDPMGGLVSESMKQFLAEAAEQFDWIVLDTPPVALLTDANLLGAMVDYAVLVISAGTTPYPMVARAIEAIGAARILGVVLNRTERSQLSIGYGYYRYSYGRYAKDEGRKRWLRFGRPRRA